MVEVRHRLVLGSVISAILFGGARAPAQERPAVASLAANAPVTAHPSTDRIFKRLGFPVDAKFGNDQRTIYLYECQETEQFRDPGTITFFHDPLCTVVQADEPTPGYPKWVRKVDPIGGVTVIDIALSLTSPSLKDAASAKLRHRLEKTLAVKAAERGEKALIVDVLPVPIVFLRVYLCDARSGLIVAEASAEVQSFTHEVTLKFRLDDEQLALFHKAVSDEELYIHPYYRAKADHLSFAHFDSKSEINFAQHVNRALSHIQPNEAAPLFQDQYVEIARSVMAEVHSTVTANDPNLITLFHDEGLLIAQFFDQHDMTWNDFQAAFPNFTEQMLAEHLRPLIERSVDGEVEFHTETKAETDERSFGGGGGIFVAIPLVGAIGGQVQAEQTLIDTLSRTAGVQLERTNEKSRYRLASIKIYRRGEGKQSQGLQQSKHIQITKSAVQEYLNISPLKLMFLSEVEPSLQQTYERFDRLSKLRTRKHELEEELAKPYAELETVRKTIETMGGDLDGQRKTLVESGNSMQTEAAGMGKAEGAYNVKLDLSLRDYEVVILYRVKYQAQAGGFAWPAPATWYPDDQLKARHTAVMEEAKLLQAEHENHKLKLDEHSLAFTTADGAVTKLIGQGREVVADMQFALAECERLRAELSVVDAEIRAILAR